MKCTLVPGDLVTPWVDLAPNPHWHSPVFGRIYTVRGLFPGPHGTRIALLLEELRNVPDPIRGEPGWDAALFRKVPKPDISALRVIGVPKPEFV
jgi:hypothetical protein